MKNIIILGAGMVGRTIALDLSKSHHVTSADIDQNSLRLLEDKPDILTVILDVTDKAALANAIGDKDLVISAVPGFLGYQTMTEVIKNRKDLVDISFLPEDILHLDPLAKKNDVTVVTDCGVAPGIPNYITGYHDSLMKIKAMEYMVGGLPRIRTRPFEYKAPFSPCDVIEEYIRPVRYVENGEVKIIPALSDPEYVEFEDIGTLEAFNTDGLRSLIFTMRHIPFMKEKTLRYPGHIQIIRLLKDAGFFSQEPLKINGKELSPIELTSKILCDHWKLKSDEPEFTVMRINLIGEENGIRKEIKYELYDEYDVEEKISSMSRTTGFTATATAQMIIDGIFTEKGVFPPEIVGRNPVNFHYLITYLKNRNVTFKVTEKYI